MWQITTRSGTGRSAEFLGKYLDRQGEAGYTNYMEATAAPTHQELHRLADELWTLVRDEVEVPFSVACARCKRDNR